MNYSKSTLTNGLRFISIPLPNIKSATLAFYVATGSRYEPAPLSGISHFLEHMLFKGSKNYPTAKDLFASVERMGGVLNGWTDTEATAYWIKVPSAHVTDALSILSDMVFHSLIDNNELEKERQVILEEVARSNDSPDDLSFKNLERLLWPNQALGRPTLGTAESLGGIDQGKIKDYWKGQYRGTDILFGISGSFEEGFVRDMVEKCTPLSKTEAAHLTWEKEKVAQTAPRLKLTSRPIDQTHLSLGFRALSVNDPHRFSESVLSAILGGGAGSRLFQNIRETLGLAYAIGSDADFLHDTGAFSVHAGLNTKNTEKALIEILKEIKEIRDKLVTSEELTRAKEMLKGHFQLGLEDSHSVLDFHLRQEISTGKILTPEQVLEKLDAVSFEDINLVGKRIFRSDNLSLSLVTPLKKEANLQQILNDF